MLRLSTLGQEAWRSLQGDGAVTSAAAGVLARRLTDAGLLHPRPAAPTALSVTVVVPTHGRVAELDRCLASLAGLRVLVVDDASPDAERVASVASRHGARLVRRAANGGPAAARNTAIAEIDTELAAFLDSDCVAPAEWVAQLARHFADPAVAAVAPRIVSVRRSGTRYLDSCSTLDLGSAEARVHPGGRVGYVPTAALVVRRAALVAVGGFDEDLRYGEDVDLVWRLDAAGWRVRYDPSVEVAHDEPRTWRERLSRRYRYGTSAAALSRRHSGWLHHLRARPLPLVAVAATVARRPAISAAAVAGTVLAARRSAARAEAGISTARATAAVLAGSWLGVGRYATQFGAPRAIGALVKRSDRGRRTLAFGALALAPPVVEWVRTRPSVAVPRYLAGRLADDVAYGAGVYAGCVKERTAAPLAVAMTKSRSEQQSR
jgi:mycofactocin system glycosyltransferase